MATNTDCHGRPAEAEGQDVPSVVLGGEDDRIAWENLAAKVRAL